MKRMIVIGALVALCAVAALTSANAKEPAANSRLKEMVAQRMVSVQAPTADDSLKEKVALRMAKPEGKYAQDGNTLEELMSERDKMQKRLNELVGDEKAITWWVPANAGKGKKDGDSSDDKLSGGNPDGGQPVSFDPIFWGCDPCCSVNPCYSIYPCGFVGSTSCDCLNCDLGYVASDCFDCYDCCDCSCVPESGRHCLPLIHGVISRTLGRRLR